MSNNVCDYCHPSDQPILWQDQYCRVVLVDEAVFPGGCRVIWQQHKTGLSHLNEDERQHLFSVISEVESIIHQQLQPQHIDLIGPGATFPHLHWQVIPRYADDAHFPGPVWGAPVREGKPRSLPEAFGQAVAQGLACRFDRPENKGRHLFVIMGVSGSGKSVVAQKLSQRLGFACLDGDFLHPRANVDKMAQGHALNDSDRAPWLQALNDAAYSMLRTNSGSLLVCSALKKRYRAILRQGNPHLSFLFLDGEYAVIEERLKQRKGHFFSPQMLDSQFATLERPDTTEQDVRHIDINRPLDQVINACTRVIAQKFAAG